MNFEKIVEEASRTINVEAALIMAVAAAVVGIAIVIIRHRRLGK